MMEKINFNAEHGFSDQITLTFNYVKQEIRALLKCFAIIGLPVVFVNMFVQSYVTRISIHMAVEPDIQNVMSTFGFSMLSNFANMLMSLWILIMVVAYIRIYQDKYHTAETINVRVGEVWRVMARNLGKVFLWEILCFLMVCVGIVFFIIPGIYLAIIFAFTAHFIILKDYSLSSGISGSVDLVRGQWWNFFGYVVILELIIVMLTYFFSMPVVIMTMKSIISHQVPAAYETALGTMVATLAQAFLQIILGVGIAVRFFSSLEQREHTALLSKIDQMGGMHQTGQSEAIH